MGELNIISGDKRRILAAECCMMSKRDLRSSDLSS